jgi:hypothetical protein
MPATMGAEQCAMPVSARNGRLRGCHGVLQRGRGDSRSAGVTRAMTQCVLTSLLQIQQATITVAY